MQTPEIVKNITENEEHAEGPIAAAIERQTAKLPSDVFLWLAMGSIGTSLTLRLMERREDAIFVGTWAPTFLIFGLYNKLVKVAGTDRRKQFGKKAA